MELPITDSIIIAIAKLVDDAQVESRQPTHNDLEVQFKRAGLISADPKTQGLAVGKAKRVTAVLNWAIENDPKSGSRLISLLLSQIKAVGGFRESSPNFVGNEQIQNAMDVFKSEYYILSENGDVSTMILDTLSGKKLTAALLSYANRAKRGVEDAALLSGTGKDLLEATAKHVIHSKFGNQTPVNTNFPTLLGQAYAALQMATSQDSKTPNELAIKDYERALFELALSINKVRNKEGTGHGRLCITSLSQDESHSIIQAVGLISEYMLNRLN
ncbi:TPA: abortive infection family protein [Salmonella enterica subsp. enterica serovar Wangata]